MPGKGANSPSITNQLRNEELERRNAVANNYDMFADDYSDTNVRFYFIGTKDEFSSSSRVPAFSVREVISENQRANI